MGILDAKARTWMQANTVEITDDVGNVFSVKRLARNVTTKKSTYAAAHKTGVHMHLRANDAGMVTAQGEPLGAGFSGFTRELTFPDDVQITDLLIDSDGLEYLVTEVTPHMPGGWLELSAVKYEPPSF